MKHTLKSTLRSEAYLIGLVFSAFLPMTHTNALGDEQIMSAARVFSQ
ncbi:MAG: hypothetical protein MKZ95_04730 [Pirellulales bacterium]|nr:hypothetical protein [Pirellulales bacterium]